MLILAYALGLLLCFYLLSVICEDFFVPSLEKISDKLKLSPDVAGATFMAIGSSAPELFTALIAITRVGAENVGAGTIVGSAIFNVLVIIGVSAMVATAYLSWRPVLRDLLFYIISIVILLITFQDGKIKLYEAGIYLGAYVVYLLLLSQWSKWFPHIEREQAPSEMIAEASEEARQAGFFGSIKGVIDRFFVAIFPKPERYMLVFLLSILLIGAISWGLVELAILLAVELGISQVIIALTVLAAGTSVPDMLSSIIVAKKGNGDMAVSNAVGSNTFDILIGLGLPWMLYIAFTGNNFTVSTENLASSILLLFFTVVALLVLLCAQRFRMGRWSGLILVALYVGYLVYAVYSIDHPDPLGLDAWLKQLG